MIELREMLVRDAYADAALWARLQTLVAYPRSALSGRAEHLATEPMAHQTETKVIVAYDAETVVGWCLVFAPLAKDPSRYDFHVFVDPAHRRRGAGSMMLRHASAMVAPSSLCLWAANDASAMFYHSAPWGENVHVKDVFDGRTELTRKECMGWPEHQ